LFSTLELQRLRPRIEIVGKGLYKHLNLKPETHPFLRSMVDKLYERTRR